MQSEAAEGLSQTLPKSETRWHILVWPTATLNSMGCLHHLLQPTGVQSVPIANSATWTERAALIACEKAIRVKDSTGVNHDSGQQDGVELPLTEAEFVFFPVQQGKVQGTMNTVATSAKIPSDSDATGGSVVSPNGRFRQTQCVRD
jgi:hypothetical protein